MTDNLLKAARELGKMEAYIEQRMGQQQYAGGEAPDDEQRQKYERKLERAYKRVFREQRKRLLKAVKQMRR